MRDSLLNPGLLTRFRVTLHLFSLTRCGHLGSYEAIFRLFKDYFEGMLGSFDKAFEGLLEGVLRGIRGRVLVMLASSDA